MSMKRISRILGYWACLAVFLLSACIENDFPYPTVKLYLTGLTVEGQVGTTLLSNDDRTATVELDETVNIRKVHIQSLEVTEGGKASIPSDYFVFVSGLSLDYHSQSDDRADFFGRRTDRAGLFLSGYPGSFCQPSER